MFNGIWFSNHDNARFYHLVFTYDATLPIVSVHSQHSSDVIFSMDFIYYTHLLIRCFVFRCEIAAGQNITKEQDRINTSGFYFEMGIAQFGAWSSFAASVGLTVFALLKLVSDHQLRNMRASMYLERQRLVNEDSFRDDGISDMPHTQNYSQDSS